MVAKIVTITPENLTPAGQNLPPVPLQASSLEVEGDLESACDALGAQVHPRLLPSEKVGTQNELSVHQCIYHILGFCLIKKKQRSTVDFQLVVQKSRRESAHVHTWA